jgi:DNA polymerase-1
MKVVVLAIMYGLSAYSLGESLKISTDAAEQLIEDFYKAYPKVYEWIQSVWEQVKANEYVETLYGRKRRFPGHREQAIIYDEAAAEICKILELDKAPSSLWAYGNVIPYELKKRYNAVAKDVSRVRRMAVNAIIQGTAADIMKLALIGLHEYTERKGWALNGTVHDEALLLVPETITLADVEEMESIMTSVVELAVPLKCDTEMFRRYGEGIKKSEWFEGVAA